MCNCHPSNVLDVVFEDLRTPLQNLTRNIVEECMEWRLLIPVQVTDAGAIFYQQARNFIILVFSHSKVKWRAESISQSALWASGTYFP